jgi:hypothetical protein
MSDKPIYLTTKRLLYNLARVDFDYGRITQEELNKFKKDWEAEYNNDDIQSKLAKKYSTNEK